MRLKRRIERLRNAMILSYICHDGDLSNLEVLRISERLDEQLNNYIRYTRQRTLLVGRLISPLQATRPS
ncbi:Spo0E family sporulation regulatory protein-aspartic acid phosphatase [Cohnella yongneupensis]|uniref:Spo0E family sporulation regulatory protein-aspartic acid phosphatase n=1 Tax=Cohnella yongneupensis TaxID=425006 RepID=A0ABW0R7L7_9BACL